MRSAALLVVGGVAGVALVVACDDDAALPDARAADAATCNCPAAEPPLAGRIIYVEQTKPVGTGGVTAEADCGLTGIALGGSCRLKQNSVIPIFGKLLAGGSDLSNPDNSAYACGIPGLGDPIDDEVTATAVCLLPP
jgi:hypothetical protein